MKKSIGFFIIILLVIMSVMFSGCYKNRMLEYYSNDSNYETLEIRVVNLDDEFMEVEFLSDVHEHYTYAPFRLIDLPALHTQIKIGDKISIITAPRFFWDNYRIPIVGITKDDTVILDFETGKQKLLDYIESTQS